MVGMNIIRYKTWYTANVYSDLAAQEFLASKMTDLPSHMMIDSLANTVFLTSSKLLNQAVVHVELKQWYIPDFEFLSQVCGLIIPAEHTSVDE